MNKVTPLAGKILLRMIPQKVDKVGMIAIPDEIGVQLRTYEIGIIEAIGDTAFDYAPASKKLCNVGDRALIVKWAGVVLAENAGYSHRPKGDEIVHRIVNDEDILAIEEITHE